MSKIYCLQYKRIKLTTYCLACRKHTNNTASGKLTMTNKVVRDKSRYGECLFNKSRFLKQKPNKKVVIKCYKTSMLMYCLKSKRNIKNKDAKMVKAE